MNVIIIPFAEYTHKNNLLDRMLLDYTLDNIHKINADQVVICQSKTDIDAHIEEINGQQVRFLENCNEGHQENVERGINTLSSGDKFIVMDSDVVIYDSTVFTDIFTDLNYYDIVGNLDGGTQIHPKHVLFEDWQHADMGDPENLIYRIPIMRPTANRGMKTRFAATLFGCSYDFYMSYYKNQHNISPVESMEVFSRNVAELLPTVRVKEMYDYRNSVTISHTNEITTYRNSDDLRIDEKTFHAAKYYHIRNFGETIRGIYNFFCGRIFAPQMIGNQSDGLRLLSWFQIILEKICVRHPEYAIYMKNINALLNNYNIDLAFYQSHLSLTKQYHRTHLL